MLPNRPFRFAMLALMVLLSVMLPACVAERPQTVPLSYAPTVAPPQAPPAYTYSAPCSRAPTYTAPTAPPTYAAVPAQPVAVEYRTGVEERTRAALAVPPDVAACLVTAGGKMLLDGIGGIQCALDALVPRVTPSARYVFPDYATARPTAPTYCAPQAPPPPMPVPAAPSAAPCR